MHLQLLFQEVMYLLQLEVVEQEAVELRETLEETQHLIQLTLKEAEVVEDLEKARLHCERAPPLQNYQLEHTPLQWREITEEEALEANESLYIEGMPGVGKTTLTRKLVEKLRGKLSTARECCQAPAGGAATV